MSLRNRVERLDEKLQPITNDLFVLVVNIVGEPCCTEEQVEQAKARAEGSSCAVVMRECE